MGAGAGSVVIGANDRNTNGGAYVTNHALHVIDVGGGGGGTGDVNIVAVGGNAVTTTVPVSGTVTDNAQVTEDDAVPATPDLLPVAVERDDSLSTLSEADGDWVHLRVDSRGALWVRKSEVLSKLSASTDSQPIAVAATASPGTTIHVVPQNAKHKVFLEASNVTTTGRILTLQWGGTAVAQEMDFEVPPNGTITIALWELVAPTTGSFTIRAYVAGGANACNIRGQVEEL